ncbi:2-polyprenyl-3-methyl-5-hydroxy-6-metoxy-1,4-benzoquinol methylase [Candidatus Methanophagaceae archaeon]|nr:2-polyprenyl-3-methyl-5-hydroxy-6-metoxy-1,4-benzoquinol methylase [Methanophagales archaeon]
MKNKEYDFNVAKNFDEVEDIYSDYVPSRYLKNVFNRSILNYVRKQGEHTILDVGCGGGYWIEYLLENVPDTITQLDGIDISENMCEVASNRIRKKKYIGEINIKLANIVDYSCPHKYTLIYLIDVVQHIPKISHLKLFSNCHNLLQDEGILVIIDKEKNSVYGVKMTIKKKLRLVPRHYLTAKYPSFKSLVKIGESCGFRKIGFDKEAYFRSVCFRKVEGLKTDGN